MIPKLQPAAFLAFVNNSGIRHHTFSNIRQTALQKTVNYTLKGRLSQCERRPFGTADITYWFSTGCVGRYGYVQSVLVEGDS